MSDLSSTVEILAMAKAILGKNGPIEIDSSIYSHNFDMEEKEKDDIHILGKNGCEITIEAIIDLLTLLSDLVDDLEDETGRTYRFEGIDKVSDTKYSFWWGS